MWTSLLPFQVCSSFIFPGVFYLSRCGERKASSALSYSPEISCISGTYFVCDIIYGYIYHTHQWYSFHLRRNYVGLKFDDNADLCNIISDIFSLTLLRSAFSPTWRSVKVNIWWYCDVISHFHKYCKDNAKELISMINSPAQSSV